jgi:hypothetical protein
MDNTLERKQRAVDWACYPVRKVEAGGGKYHLIDGSTGRIISEVSKRYELVPNEKVFRPFVNQFGLENLKRFFQYGNGKYAYAEFNTGRRFNLGTDEAPDIVDERLVVQNSYNRTRAFSFMYGAFRQVCANGLYSGQAIIAFRKKHVGDIPVDEMVNTVFNNYQQNNFDLWRKLKEAALSKDEEIALVNDFQAYEVKNTEANSAHWDRNSNKQINNRIQSLAIRYIEGPESVDNQRSGWGIYNQINRAIAGIVDGRSQVNKVILGNKNAEIYLSGKLSLN